MLLLIIAFFAGILTILAPCVLPVLPVIIGGSISGGKKDKLRPYVIGASLAFSIIFFTLILKFSTFLVGISSFTLSWISGILLIGLGIVAIWPDLWEKLMIRFNWQAASQRLLGKGGQNKNRFIGPILIGLALGPVFASCSPTYAFILASVLPISFFAGLIYLVIYSIGLALALLLISLGGKKLISKYTWAIDIHSLFRRMLGLLFVIIGVAIISGYQVTAETWVANHLPFDETRIERVLLAKQQKSNLFHNISNNFSRANVLNVQATQAPELQGLTNWINSSPLTLQQLRGKVVLVDFWTYSCINCIRSIPYVEKWYQTYKDKGLVVLGINTPEFAFEHNPNNVASAVKRFGITYPVALDNNYDTWNAFQNSSWPADYLIDQSGNVRYVSLGEGDYGTTEQAIQVLLGINQPLKTAKFNVPISSSQTPETYFGTNREAGYIGSPNLNTETANFQPESNLSDNSWTLSGKWTISPEYITSNSSASTLKFNVNAKDVYMVAGSANNQPAQVVVNLPSPQSSQYGSDAPNGVVAISGSRLYHIVSLSKTGTTTVTLTVPKNVSLYTFTFGS
jgi:cytochrome c biogenesis protein CcdA/thiol-disulfide isomerase/thioredoxin